MRNLNIKSLTEGGLLTALMVVAALISIYVPVFGLIAALIWPIPLVVLVVRHGIRWGILSCIVASTLMSILISPVLAIRLIVGLALPSLVIGYGFHKNWGAGKTLIIGLSASVISMLAAFAMIFAIASINPLSQSIELVQKSFEASFAAYEAIGVDSAELAETKSAISSAVDMLTILMPIALISSSMLTTWISFALSGKVLRRLGHQVATLPPFNEWRMPVAFFYICGFSLVAWYWGSAHDIPLLYQAGINCYVLTSLVGLIQASAVLSALFSKFHISKIIYWFVLIFVLINGITNQVFSLLGIIDLIVDYRKRFDIN